MRVATKDLIAGMELGGDVSNVNGLEGSSTGGSASGRKLAARSRPSNGGSFNEWRNG